MSDQNEEQVAHLDISPVLGVILSNMKIPVLPEGHAATWQLVPIEGEDGKKDVAAALAFTTGNGIDIYWFGLNDLQMFVGQVNQVLQTMVVESQKLNPLIVANQSQMQQILSSKENMDRQINWPSN